MNEIKNRVEALRNEMKKQNLDAFYISGTDPHASEYLPFHWKTREFITGFSGSFGMVIITKNEALLWTDTRYFLQAEEQLIGSGIKMQKLRVPNAISPENWLKENLKSGNKVGVDTQTVSISVFKNLNNLLSEKSIELISSGDLLSNIWINRPPIPLSKVFELDVKYAGFSRQEKQDMIAHELEKSNADFQIISMLDELAWLFNLRGSDIDYNPVFMGFGIIGKSIRKLFVHENKIDRALRHKLIKEGIEIEDYNNFYSFLASFENKRILLDPSTVNHKVYGALSLENSIIEDVSPVSMLKAIKNDTELGGFRETMKKDGAALVEFLYWIKNNVGNKRITEFDVGEKLAEFRSSQNDFKGESFPPIVGYKAHGAIVHLSVNEENALPIEPEGLLLFDSGGQYLQGTTDITRTVALGKITKQQKRDFTLVLKGMIALTNAKFPEGTKGCHIDILARKALWDNGKNYGHGTGHGVGHFLNVHEGPMSIRQEINAVPIQPGMVMSNEPAFYREGEYGIRTENMMVCVEKEENSFGKFFGFETLTLCPIDTELIDLEIFTSEEKLWLNDYHQRVKKELKPLIHQKFYDFLDDLTKKI